MNKYRNHKPIINSDEMRRRYSSHVRAMTEEGLHSKSDIAEELAVRDADSEELKSALLEAANQLDMLGEPVAAYSARRAAGVEESDE